MEVEEPLPGGFGGLGQVVRIGDTIRRPPRESSAGMRALLVHLEQCDFEGAPRVHGIDDQGRDVLDYLEGDVPLPPYPAWAMTDEALVSFAQLLRRYHDAVASFDGSRVAGWGVNWADPGGGPVVCHNDVFPENVVFRDGLVVALIDFAEAAPGRPFWDLAVAAEEWMPLHAPPNRRDHEYPLDAVGRFGTFARAYGVAPGDADELVDVVFECRAQMLGNIRREIALGEEVWVERWRDGSEEARAVVEGAWLTEQRPALVAAVQRS